MIHLRAWPKAFIAIFLIIIFVFLSTDCITKTNTTYELLKSYINMTYLLNDNLLRIFSSFLGVCRNF